MFRDVDQPKRGQRVILALDGQRLDRFGVRAVPDERIRRFAEQDLAGGRVLFEARGHVDRVAHGERIDLRGVSGEHVAGVDAGASLQTDAESLVELVVERVQRGQHPDAARTARSASSSWETGTPKNATTASPMNLSTRPPWRCTSPRMTS